MPRPIGEQVMVVAGASSGVGLATAREAARRGARVVLAARNTLDLAAAAEAIRRDGGQAVAVPADVADYAQVEALAARAVEAFGRIDTWVTTAAVSAYAPFREQPLEDFRRVLEVDFMGQVHCARAALPHLEQTGGALICIGSVLSDRGVPLQGAYCAAKHALKGWLDSLRMELRHAGSAVRVTLVKPSAMDTPLFEKAKTQMGVAPQPIPPVYQPELAVEAILRAAEGNERDAFVGGAGKLLSVAERVSPRLVDLLQLRKGFLSQRGDRPRSADAPNNLYAPVEYDGGVRGLFGAQARRWSPYQALEAHAATAALLGAGALAVAALAGRGATGRRLRPLLSTGAALLAGKSLLVRAARG
ncbi:MAG TPA: SDR family oxidoreductase [Longimicrobium sp.]|jgi:NAD(P)-dependent dehydrogenase (short-subunit alcohol dehydrogenase family)